MCLMQFLPWKVPAVVGSIMLVGVLTHCTLVHTVSDWKVTQITGNLEFKLGCNDARGGQPETFVVRKLKKQLIMVQ